LTAALLSERLHVNPGDSKGAYFSFRNKPRNFWEKKYQHCIVAVDEQDDIMGWAEDISVEDPIVEVTPDGRVKRRAGSVARLPKKSCKKIAERPGKEAVVIEEVGGGAGEEEYQNLSSRPAIALLVGLACKNYVHCIRNLQADSRYAFQS
jgi:hypothetical protein